MHLFTCVFGCAGSLLLHVWLFLVVASGVYSLVGMLQPLLLLCGLSSCGARTSLLLGIWNLARPGSEPKSAALAGVFLTSGPPGKS